MPMPVSLTSNSTPAQPSGARCGLSRSVTPPRSVNLIALPTRLSSTCFRRCASPMTQSSTSGSRSSRSVSPLLSALARNSAITDSAIAFSDIGWYCRLSLPASIFEWSSTSFRMAINEAPDDAAVRTSRRWSTSSCERRSRSSAPSTPFIGVRISWLIVARNCDFATFADSASSLARCSETVATSASWLCRMARDAVDLNSREARYTVAPKISASTVNGIERTAGIARLAMIKAPSWMPARITNERPTSVMKNAATVIEPNTMAT